MSTPAAKATSSFAPRATYALPPTLPRSYYLGHHAAGLARMRTLLSTVDLVLEVRDFRAPLTSRNPLLERALRSTDAGGPRARITVYSKRDLGGPWARGPRSRGALLEDALRARLTPTPAVEVEDGENAPPTDDVFFLASGTQAAPRAYSAAALLQRIRAHAASRFSVTGTRVLVAGMPNVGKSTLINGLRAASSVRSSRTARKPKVAATGGLPGVTRSVGGPVKILEGWEVDGLAAPPPADSPVPGRRTAVSEPVYIHDTPGVFMPFVPSGHAMLKLALCGAVKEGLISPLTLADYLLWHVNRADPSAYAALLPPGAGPTDDVGAFLEGVARRTGRLGRGGVADVEAAAVWFVQRWRRGEVGRFVLDDVFGEGDAEEGEVEADGVLRDEAGVLRDEAGEPMSVSQARKAEKERRRERTRARLRARRGQS